MMLYKNTKVKDKNIFDIVASVQLGDALAPYQFIIYPDYVLRTSIDSMKENRLTLEKARSRRYLAQTITYADYADDITFLANTLTQANSLLLSPEQA